jgi:uncharacterized membrane protein (DUF4010 family)
VLQNFTINAVDILVIDFHALHIRTIGAFLPIYEVVIIMKDVTMTWQKWGSKQALEKGKTSLSLMEVFNIALKCSVFRF